jgi:hypothetical protein
MTEPATPKTHPAEALMRDVDQRVLVITPALVDGMF